MPLGNGDIGVNVWVEENGDMVFYISKTDAWSENGQLLKLGKIRVSINPSQFTKDLFSQELKLEQGEIVVSYGQSKITLWVDANNPAIQVDIDSKMPVNTQVSFETWRKTRRPITGNELHTVYGVVGETGKGPKCAKAVFQEPDTIFAGGKNQIIWYHHNSYSYWMDNLELQSLDEYIKTGKDPLLNRTFGALVEGEGLISKSDTLLVSKKPSVHFQVNIYPLTEISSSEGWKESVVRKSTEISKMPLKARRDAHYKWWQQFWARNYIFISTKDTSARNQAETVTRGYILQRFINACNGRGNAPIKFNGSIFTVDCYNRNDKFKGFDADFRQWGGPYWWQNTRLPYWSMLISGDFDMMKPLFGMYLGNIPIRKLATRKYYSHDGSIFP